MGPEVVVKLVRPLQDSNYAYIMYDVQTHNTKLHSTSSFYGPSVLWPVVIFATYLCTQYTWNKQYYIGWSSATATAEAVTINEEIHCTYFCVI